LFTIQILLGTSTKRMFARRIAALLFFNAFLLFASFAAAQYAARIPAPEDVIGFRPGDDRKLASWSEVITYFRRLAQTSNRVRFEEIGKTTMGAPFVYATISAPENLARLDEYKEIQRQLADPRILGAPKNQAAADAKAAELIKRGKTIVLITCGIHSTEVGSYLSSMLIAHRLASSDEPEVQSILRNTIILLVPSLNPDGVDIVKNWYDKTLGTPYEGTSPPELYHKYVGHDDNRDWYAFTQVETQLTVDKIHNVWHPQIVHDIHQQGEYGARLFLPPYMQPVEPNVPKQIVEGYTELGRFIAREMRARGFQGITTDSTYDAWTPSRAYSHYHGGVRILSETASCKLATPITVKFEQLSSREGYDPQKESPNFFPLWRGGEWHLRDITNYMTTAAFLLLGHAANNRTEWLTRFYSIGKDAVRERKKGELFGLEILPSHNSDKLINILKRGGVEIIESSRSNSEGKLALTSVVGIKDEEATIIDVRQPYANFAKALLENQRYPNLRDSSGNPIAPYDVTAHTLSLLMGVKTQEIYQPLKYKRAIISTPLMGALGCREMPDSGFPVAIYQSHIPSIDEGWTRWIFDERKDRFIIIHDRDIRSKDFTYKSSPLIERKYDTIIIPDQSPRAILNGYRKGTMPDELTGGLGAEGVRALREFVESGGTLVLLNRASDFAIEQFKLPVRDVTAGLPRTEYYAPGSILRTILDTSHPIAAGMPRESIAWVEDSPVFEVDEQAANGKVHVIARYPADRDPLLSGWLLGGDRLRGKAALVEVEMGKGRVVLFGFRPQYRGQSLATYPLFFNAISGAKK
jgi:hypothetical protein